MSDRTVSLYKIYATDRAGVRGRHAPMRLRIFNQTL